MKTVEFYYDLVSPYSYLAHGEVSRICEERGAELSLRPMLLGAVHNAVGLQAPIETKPKARYQAKDIQRWAEHYGLPMEFSDPFPFRTLKTMRAAMFLEARGELEAFTREAFALYWVNAVETANPAGTELIPGLQIDGYFPDRSKSNCYNNEDEFPCHDSQFVIRLPREEDWNGKLVITGAPGVRKQYALDFIISDYVLSKGYAFASTDKGNTGTNFWNDGSKPGGSVAEWNRRVEQLTKAAKTTVERRYGKKPEFTYMTGISNGGYLTRHAIENNPGLYDGSVDWEGVLWRRNGPNLFTHLPQALRHWNECQTSAPEYDRHACELMRRAGYPKGSEFLWEEHYVTYWDLTQRIYREEFDPGYDGDTQEEDGIPGAPNCQEEVTPPPKCDANYQYKKRPERVKEAVEKVSLNGDIGKPMLTVTGTYDVLLPMRLHSNRYRALIENKGKGNMHRYYKIENGNHVDSYFDRYRKDPAYVRPILPCYWAAFGELEEWVEKKGENPRPPGNTTVPQPTPEGTPEDANTCSINEEATYTPPVSDGP